MPVFHNGQLLITPAVASAVDDSAMRNQNLTVGNRVAIVGRSAGGAPKAPLEIRSPSHARQILRSGDLLKAVEKAFAPSPATNGPASVIVSRVNPAVQASLTLKDSADNDAIDLTSTDYGLWTNQVKVKIESGTLAGKRITTQVGNSYYSQDNIARNAFTVQYTGSAAHATIVAGMMSVVLAAGATAPGTTIETIQLATYPTVQELVDKINTVPGFTASVVAGSANTAALRGLDVVYQVDCKTAPLAIPANLQAIIDWFNSITEGYVTAARPASANQPPANTVGNNGYVTLTGGSDGTVSNADWDDAIQALEDQDVQWVVPLSSAGAVHAMAMDHVAFMSGTGKRERRAFVGGATGLSTSQAATEAAALAHDRVGYVYPGFYDYTDAGALALYPPYILAAQVAGAFAGMNPGTPLTNKPLTVQGMEAPIYAPTDTDYLINSGVLAVAKSHRGDFRVVKSISTWLSSEFYNRKEISTGVAVDYVTRNVREALFDFVGAKGSPITLAAIASRVDSTLRELAREEPAGPGIIVGDRKSPAYRNIQVELEGDVVRVEFECSPVIPVNYVLVTVHAVPYSGRLV